MQGISDFSIREYQKRLALSESHLEGLLSDTTSTLDLLDDLARSFKAVEAQTSTFQNQCEGLIDEQKRVERLADELEHNLKYYNYLEPVTRRLNAPGAGSLVRGKEFSEMLARIDDCLGYMAAHVSSKVLFDCLALIAIAQARRIGNVSVQIPALDDKRADLDPGQLRRRPSRHCLRCHKAHC